MASSVVSADITIITRARATRCAVSDSEVFAAADKLRRLPGTVFMTSTPATQRTITVAGEETGERLDRVLARHVAELSRSRLKSLIENGALTLDGRTIRDPNHRV